MHGSGGRHFILRPLEEVAHSVKCKFKNIDLLFIYYNILIDERGILISYDAVKCLYICEE